MAPGTGATEVFESALPVATAGGVFDDLVVASRHEGRAKWEAAECNRDR